MGLYDHYLAMWSSRKYPYPPQRRLMGIPRGRGHKILSMKVLYWNFKRGRWGRGVQTKNHPWEVYVYFLEQNNKGHKQGNDLTFSCHFHALKLLPQYYVCSTRNVWRLARVDKLILSICVHLLVLRNKVIQKCSQKLQNPDLIQQLAAAVCRFMSVFCIAPLVHVCICSFGMSHRGSVGFNILSTGG